MIKFFEDMCKRFDESNFMEFIRYNVPLRDKYVVYFGLFCLTCTAITMYVIPNKPLDNKDPLLFYYQTMLMVSVLSTAYPVWPPSLRNDVWVPIFWNIGIIYVPIICMTFFVMLSNYNELQTCALLGGMVALTILVSWRVALGMILLGVFIGFKCYESYIHESVSLASVMEAAHVRLEYSLFVVAAIVAMIIRPDRGVYHLTEEMRKELGENSFGSRWSGRSDQIYTEFVRSLGKEMAGEIKADNDMSRIFIKNYDKLTQEQKDRCMLLITDAGRWYKRHAENILDLAKISSPNFKLNKKEINFSKLMCSSIDSTAKTYLGYKPLRFMTSVNKDVMYTCDEYCMRLVFENLLINAMNYSREGKVILVIDDLEDKMCFSIFDQGIGVPKEDLEKIFDLFGVSSRTAMLPGCKGVGLALCKKIIELHGGKIWAESNGNREVTFKFEIPKSKEEKAKWRELHKDDKKGKK